MQVTGSIPPPPHLPKDRIRSVKSEPPNVSDILVTLKRTLIQSQGRRINNNSSIQNLGEKRKPNKWYELQNEILIFFYKFNYELKLQFQYT